MPYDAEMRCGIDPEYQIGHLNSSLNNSLMIKRAIIIMRNRERMG